ncbi:MAG: sulfurtransferase [Spirochaetes bacterium]|nr:MAG: sulfurtransferase [Spirochaetota bacterium]
MKIKSLITIILLVLILSGCGVKSTGEKGTEIITAKDYQTIINDENIILVDARTSLDYKKGHILSSVNVSRADIVVNSPFPNMLCAPEQLEKILGKKGISNSSTIIVYDANKNMDSARLWWTLKIYGHKNVKVVSGGFDALIAKGMAVTTDLPKVANTTYKTQALNKDMLALKKDIKNQINNPDSNTKIIDTRSLDEYNEGTIPGSILLNFTGNNFPDQTYKPVSQIQIRYLQEDIDYNDTIIMFCKTSIRGAQTYLALYNAGYRNLKLYDGAWVEWSASPANPVFKPETKVYQIDSSDNS